MFPLSSHPILSLKQKSCAAFCLETWKLIEEVSLYIFKAYTYGISRKCCSAFGTLGGVPGGPVTFWAYYYCALRTFRCPFKENAQTHKLTQTLSAKTWSTE